MAVCVICLALQNPVFFVSGMLFSSTWLMVISCLAFSCINRVINPKLLLCHQVYLHEILLDNFRCVFLSLVAMSAMSVSAFCEFGEPAICR